MEQKTFLNKSALLWASKGFYFSISLLFVYSAVATPSIQPPPVQTVTVFEKWQAPVFKPFNLPISLNPASPAQAAVKPLPPINPFANVKLYLNPSSPAKIQALAWQTTRPSDAALLDKIAAQPTAIWLGDWTTDVKAESSRITTAAAAENSLPILVAYNLPKRDCGGYSGGGASSAADYKLWIQNLAAGVATHKAAVILEPDSLGVIDCLSAAELANRYSLLSYAVQTLTSHSNTYVYIDAGHAGWLPSTEMASRLNKAGLQQATGFALNVSNFFASDVNNNYGHEISKLVGGKHYVVDSGRNGAGSNGGWCNPDGMALGKTPQPGSSGLLDAYLWIKTPGESDGTCNGGPAAGTFWPEYALGLAGRANY